MYDRCSLLLGKIKVLDPPRPDEQESHVEEDGASGFLRYFNHSLIIFLLVFPLTTFQDSKVEKWIEVIEIS